MKPPLNALRERYWLKYGLQDFIRSQKRQSPEKSGLCRYKYGGGDVFYFDVYRRPLRFYLERKQLQKQSVINIFCLLCHAYNQ